MWINSTFEAAQGADAPAAAFPASEVRRQAQLLGWARAASEAPTKSAQGSLRGAHAPSAEGGRAEGPGVGAGRPAAWVPRVPAPTEGGGGRLQLGPVCPAVQTLLWTVLSILGAPDC